MSGFPPRSVIYEISSTDKNKKFVVTNTKQKPSHGPNVVRISSHLYQSKC